MTFSTPEVTANHRFAVPDAPADGERIPRIKIRKLKKRRRHHSDEEEYTEGRGREEVGSKRRRTSEESEGGSYPRQPRSMGMDDCMCERMFEF